IDDVADLNKSFMEKQKTDFDALKAENATLLDRIEELESNYSRPRKTAGDERPDVPEYTRAFLGWIRRRGNSPADEAKLQELMAQKDVTIGSQAGGGYALPKEIWREIEAFQLKFSPVRRLVKVLRASTSDFHHLVNLRGLTSGWVGETATRS